jgi:predicted nucleic acid-binding protein
MRIWVVNTSPLVFLGNLSRLELLRHEGREVYIPRAVGEEIAEKPDAAAQAVQAACATWMQVRNVTDATAVTLVQASQHKGEAEAIVLATELHAERLVMDNQDARRFANRWGLTVILSASPEP